MNELPVREMVLYKHGVGAFVRRGRVSGASLDLTFRQDEINDILKSLTILDEGGGQVLGIHYPTPMDLEDRMSRTSIRLRDSVALRDLLRQLRGRDVELTLETQAGALETLTGRMVGIDEPELTTLAGSDTARTLVAVLDEYGQVRVLRYDAVRAVRIVHAQTDEDLRYFLDTTVGDDTRRSVNVRLSDGEHDLSLFYVAPSPTWRVSYRLIANSQGTGGGQGLLQAWGIFDNRLEEDLEDVRVTFVAGQPVSFIYDLYKSFIPARPVVEDEARIAPGPIEYEGAMLLEQPEAKMGYSEVNSARAFVSYAAQDDTFARRITQDMARGATAVQATGKDSGEFFQYIVTTPVSVKRGESALVPILNAEVRYERELLYNGDKLPDHPVAALRFANSSGLTLERGPVTVVEDGDYKGEAVVPFTRESGEIYLPYAVELSLHITESDARQVVTQGLSFDQAYMLYQQYQIFTTTYALHNRSAEARTVVIEAPALMHGRELYETTAPYHDTPTERRWRVEVAARATVEFLVRERESFVRKDALTNLDYEKLRQFLANRWLEEGVYATLTALLQARHDQQVAQERLKAIEGERKAVYAAQEQARTNLGSLQQVGREGELRDRLLTQFESLQDRLDAFDAEAASLNAALSDAERRVKEFMASLPSRSASQPRAEGG